MTNDPSKDDEQLTVEELHRTPESEIDPPPIMKSWRQFYALVLAVLAADVVVFWLVTRVFS